METIPKKEQYEISYLAFVLLAVLVMSCAGNTSRNSVAPQHPLVTEETMLSKFHYKNFEPTFETRISAEEVLQRLEDFSPTNSTVMGLVEHVGTEYCVSIDVYSVGGTFLATANDADPIRAIQVAEEKVAAKISQWKRGRFQQSLPPMPQRDKDTVRAKA
ncbi:MAG: hypothetical protein ABIR96_05060 [Bdellovibrionota bacterium]